MSISERQNDILEIIEHLDISPTMYQNAIEKYNHLTTYLEKHGYAVKMYPQGSFALGTVVRPIHRGDDASYWGSVQSYCDWFSAPEPDTVAPILLQIEANEQYRGHHSCFCGSGRKMRDCHGQKILYFYQYPELREQLISDLKNIRKEFQETANERNSAASK